MTASAADLQELLRTCLAALKLNGYNMDKGEVVHFRQSLPFLMFVGMDKNFNYGVYKSSRHAPLGDDTCKCNICLLIIPILCEFERNHQNE